MGETLFTVTLTSKCEAFYLQELNSSRNEITHCRAWVLNPRSCSHSTRNTMESVTCLGLFTAWLRAIISAEPAEYFNTFSVVCLEMTAIPDACVTWKYAGGHGHA